jgi:hypothetical protein
MEFDAKCRNQRRDFDTSTHVRHLAEVECRNYVMNLRG